MADAFSSVREIVGAARVPKIQAKNDDELKQMTHADGLAILNKNEDLALAPNFEVPVPEVTELMKKQAHLWVVRLEDTVHAEEYGPFGASLENGCIKHTNLTGGEPAFAGGELIWINEKEVLVNGCSGRYRPQTANEMDAVAAAFVGSGYITWSTGFDEGSGYCFRFGASIPKLVVVS